jgi:hypothetical protein
MWMALAFPLLLMALVLGVGRLDSVVTPGTRRTDELTLDTAKDS